MSPLRNAALLNCNKTDSHQNPIKGEWKMTCYEELKARGLIAQVTN